MAAFLKLEGGGCPFPEKESLAHLVELQGHVLHGFFHSNGFGHLLSLNGIESGSDLTGHQVMELWDRLCTGLKARYEPLLYMYIIWYKPFNTILLVSYHNAINWDLHIFISFD